MLDGEVFRYKEYTKIYSEFDCHTRAVRFKCVHEEGNISEIEGLWSDVTEWEIHREPTWEDSLDEYNVLCWVSDMDKDLKRHPRCIVSLEVSQYRASSGDIWTFATPIKPEDCYQGEQNE